MIFKYKFIPIAGFFDQLIHNKLVNFSEKPESYGPCQKDSEIQRHAGNSKGATPRCYCFCYGYIFFVKKVLDLIN